MAQWIKGGKRLLNVDAVGAVVHHSNHTYVFLSGIGDNPYTRFEAEEGRRLWE